MKPWIGLLVAVGLTLQTGCRPKENPTSGGDGLELLARWHFVGTGTVSTNSGKLAEIWKKPETRQLAEQTLQKLSHVPRTLFPGAVDAAQDERGAALLLPLIGELVRTESFALIRSKGDQPAEWTALVNLPGGRAREWKAAITELVQLWKLGSVATNTVEGVPCLEVRRSGDPGLVRWAEAGDWFVLGVGRENTATANEAMRRLKSGSRPVPAAGDYWLDGELNLPRLARLLEFAPELKWPSARFSIKGQGENLRSTGRLQFEGPSTGPLTPWRIPANFIKDPLISFTAARGVEPVLRSTGIFGKLGIDPVPNEFFVWAQSSVAFQTFWTWPGTDASEVVERVAERAPAALGTNWQERGLAQISFQQTNQMAFWRGLPIVTPYLGTRRDGAQEYVFGGLFAAMPSTNPVPAELLAQVTGRTNLVYYNWEITENRLSQWTILAQTAAVATSAPQLRTNSASLRWLLSVAPSLGNTATEVVADSPSQWSFTRRSHLGLTGFEITVLARWLESTNFPRLSFDLPSTGPVIPVRPPPGPKPPK